MQIRKLFAPLFFLPVLRLLQPALRLPTSRNTNVPTLNTRPHDPAVAPDPSLWLTEQVAKQPAPRGLLQDGHFHSRICGLSIPSAYA